MRSLLAGFILLLTASAALAQAKGEVEVIGFDNIFRPDCWTAMVVRLKPETSDVGTYLIQVVQEDLDRDRVLYERTITLTGNTEGQGVREQRFWMYFIPEANPKGMLGVQTSLVGLQEHLKVFLCTTGGKQITQLPITAPVKALDQDPSPRHRGHKLILLVADPDAASQSIRPESESMAGLMEDWAMVPLRPADLPENILGYEAVDAIVMLNVDPDNLKNPTDERMKAVKEYVRQGGNLVICQTAQWEKMTRWGDLLALSYPKIGADESATQGVVDLMSLDTLKEWSRPKIESDSEKKDRELEWSLPKGPFKVGLVEAKPGTMVEEWMQWPKESGLPAQTPYLARWVYGAGGVTWVAQDLGNRGITSFARIGWPEIWGHVFGWKNDVMVRPGNGNTDAGPEKLFKDHEQNYSPDAGSMVDLGRPLLHGMDHDRRGAALVSLAILFFIAYWVVAAPVSYFVLAGKGKSSLSWFVFAGSAIAATLLTALVVDLVLRGAAQVRHVSVVRMSPGEPAVVYSRIGLYIPRDGPQKIELKDTAADSVSYIAPYAIHPAYVQENEYPAYMEYEIPVRDATAGKPPAVAVPYRRTLKKLEVKWVGNLGAGIQGNGTLRVGSDETKLAGLLTNGAGRNFKNIYIAFRYPYSLGTLQDGVFYLPTWDKGETKDLSTLEKLQFVGDQNAPGDGKGLQGRVGSGGIELEWDRFWFRPLRQAGKVPGMMGEVTSYNDYDDRAPRSFPMLSLFGRLPPAKSESVSETARVDPLRRAARQLDLSAAETAGGMVILAEADDTPLPFGFMVDGDDVAGQGKTFYQFVLPLERVIVKPAATQVGQ